MVEREGAKIVVSDLDERGGQAVVDEIGVAGGEAVLCITMSALKRAGRR